MDNEGIIKYRDENKKVNEDQEGLLSMPILFLNGSQLWEEGKMDSAVVLVSEWPVEQFGWQNGPVSFLKDILHIGFPFLDSLSLTYCKIASLECLNWIQCPQLRTLYLGGNQITSIKSIRKSNWAYINTIQQNPVHDDFRLTELKNSWITGLSVPKSGISWIFKMEYKGLIQLYLLGNLIQEKCFKIIGKKYLDFQSNQ